MLDGSGLSAASTVVLLKPPLAAWPAAPLSVKVFRTPRALRSLGNVVPAVGLAVVAASVPNEFAGAHGNAVTQRSVWSVTLPVGSS